MNLTRAASFLGIRARTLRLAVGRGKINAQHPFRDGPWVFNRSELQSQAATDLAKRVAAGGRNLAVHQSEQATLEFSSK